MSRKPMVLKSQKHMGEEFVFYSNVLFQLHKAFLWVEFSKFMTAEGSRDLAFLV